MYLRKKIESGLAGTVLIEMFGCWGKGFLPDEPVNCGDDSFGVSLESRCGQEVVRRRITNLTKNLLFVETAFPYDYRTTLVGWLYDNVTAGTQIRKGFLLILCQVGVANWSGDDAVDVPLNLSNVMLNIRGEVERWLFQLDVFEKVFKHISVWK